MTVKELFHWTKSTNQSEIKSKFSDPVLLSCYDFEGTRLYKEITLIKRDTSCGQPVNTGSRRRGRYWEVRRPSPRTLPPPVVSNATDDAGSLESPNSGVGSGAARGSPSSVIMYPSKFPSNEKEEASGGRESKISHQGKALYMPAASHLGRHRQPWGRNDLDGLHGDSWRKPMLLGPFTTF
jgi:hypothetical protein